MRWSVVGILLLLSSGCVTEPPDPVFPVRMEQAHQDLARMREKPVPLSRPLVIVGGYLDPHISPPWEEVINDISIHSVIIQVTLNNCGSFEECRDRIIVAVDKTCPSGDPIWTSRVDVVGLSLGGLAARYAAAPSQRANHSRRLNIARLFTISSPHTGAKIAFAAITPFQKDIKPHSDFLQYVARFDVSANYQLVAYVHLDDEIVGDRNAAPPGKNVYWLANTFPFLPHGGAISDERIVCDVARRLRGETPFTISPPAPLPQFAFR